MGEAKRRGSRPPTPFEKARRLTLRYWRMYPGWLRSFYKITYGAAAIYLLIALLRLESHGLPTAPVSAGPDKPPTFTCVWAGE